MITERARTAHTTSADGLARRALDALRDAGGTALGNTAPAAAHLAEAAEQSGGELAVALGAVRLLGADVLAPSLLTSRPPLPDEVTAIGLALTALPPNEPPPPAPPEGSAQPWVRAWLDWGLGAALAHLGPLESTVGKPAVPPPAAPLPPGPPLCDDGSPHRPATRENRSGGLSHEGWIPWSERMGQLSSLALPGLEGPVHDAVRSGALGLARGAARAMLRRDFPTAARITRWLAWLTAQRIPPPCDPVPLTEHLGLVGGGGRLALDMAIARRLLGLEPA